MQNIDFLLCCEVKARELESLCLLKYELENRGYKVVIRSCMELNSETKSCYNAKVVVVNALRFFSNVDYAMGKSTYFDKVIELIWEQIISEASLSTMKIIKRDEIGKNVVINAWGNISKERLIQNEGIPEDRVFVCGHPALDFCKPRFKDFYYTKAEIAKIYHLDASKTWNIFVSSFAYGTIEKEQIIALDKKLGTNLHYRMYVSSAKTQSKLLEWFSKILETKKDQIIIYRPHPAEKVEHMLRELEAKFSNFYVIRDNSIKQWINVADKLYTWISTSTIEAFFMDKPCYVLRPYPVDKDIDMEIFSESKVFIEDFDTFKKSIEEKARIFPFEEDFIRKYYYFEKEQYTYEKLADICEKVLADDKNKISEMTQQEVQKYLEKVEKSLSKKEKVIRKMRGMKIYRLYQLLFAKDVAKFQITENEIKKIEKRIAKCLCKSSS